MAGVWTSSRPPCQIVVGTVIASRSNPQWRATVTFGSRVPLGLPGHSAQSEVQYLSGVSWACVTGDVRGPRRGRTRRIAQMA